MAPLETKWQSNFASGYEITSILATKNSVYTAKNGVIFRLDDNGSVTASNNLPGTGYSEVRLAASDDGSLLIAGTNGYVVGLNAQSLQAQWTTDLPDSRYDVTNVSCVNGRVCTGCNSHLYRLNIFNGNVEAHNPLSKHGHNEVRFGHAASSKTVVVGTDGWAVGLRDENLEVVWSKELPGSGYAVCSVVGTENVAYVGTAGIVYQLEASTGKLLNRNGLSGVGSQEVRLALNKGANMLYAGTNGYGVGLRPDNVGTVYSTSLPDCGYNITDVVCGNGNAFYAYNGYVYEVNSQGDVTARNNLDGYGKDETRLAVDGQLFVGLRGVALGLSLD